MKTDPKKDQSRLSTKPADMALERLRAQLPEGRAIFVASSRLGNQPENRAPVFDALRTLAAGMDRRNEFFVTSAGTTAHPFVCRLGELFSIRVVELVQSANKEQRTPGAASTIPIEFDASSCGAIDGGVDELLSQIARVVYLLSATARGRTIGVARRRLESGFPVHLLVNGRLTAAKLQKDLFDAGAVAWYLLREKNHPQASEGDRPTEFTTEFPILRPDEIDPSQYLCHWTRRRTGAWPDQSTNSYLDDLLFGSSRAEHDPRSTLCRILAGRKLLGSSRLTRSNQPVVSFTGVPVTEFSNHRKFRSHLARWDFEPYGIAIDKPFLKSRGARAVIYGDDSRFQQLDERERPFFQIARGRSTDWTYEKEWRLTGDLELAAVAHDQAFVFVPSQTDAEVVGPLSRWPVVVLDEV